MTNMTNMEKDYLDWCGWRRYGHIDITKEEWIKWWNDTGMYDRRGKQIGCVRMHRIDTTLPFSLSNIELRTVKGARVKPAQKVTIESMNTELAIQKKLTAEWRELALDVMKKYMTQDERDDLLIGTLNAYVEKKVRKQ